MAESIAPKHAVILSGGGGYGAFEVGVMKAIFNGECASTNYQPLDADIFTGTSVGAINAAFMTCQPGRTSAETVRDLEQFWRMVSDDDTRDFLRVASPIEQRLRTGSPYKKVTIHRYRPHDDLGGVMGFLNFNRQRISELIDIGYNFARQYDPAIESIIPD